MYGLSDSYSIKEVLDIILNELRIEESKARENMSSEISGILLAKEIIKKHRNKEYC